MPNRSRWEEFLDKFYCWQDQYGNRMCDYGEPCDCCQTEQAQRKYEQWIKGIKGGDNNKDIFVTVEEVKEA